MQRVLDRLFETVAQHCQSLASTFSFIFYHLHGGPPLPVLIHAAIIIDTAQFPRPASTPTLAVFDLLQQHFQTTVYPGARFRTHF